jgi:NFU1 iron-sulfur cluster scaffold homolog, mitochondrial
MFIQTETTPNPASLKFLPGREVSLLMRDYEDAQAGAESPLAQSLFAIAGVERVFLGKDFLTVSKAASAEWAHLKPAILGAIMDHFVSGRPVLHAAEKNGNDAPNEAVYEGEAAGIVVQIKELIETRIRPAVAQDGGDIVFHSWSQETGVVKLHLRGSCAGCPSSAFTLKQGIETMLKHYVPEVTRVEPVL